MVKDRAYSQLHYGELSSASCHQGNEQEGVKRPALGSGALLLEEECLTFYTLWLPQASVKKFCQIKVTVW